MIDRGLSWGGCLAALAWACAPVWGQLGEDPKPPHRVADGDWVFDTPGGCGKALSAKRLMGAAYPDPLGTVYARELMADTDVLNCALDIEIVPTSSTAGTIAGSNTFTIKSRV